MKWPSLRYAITFTLLLAVPASGAHAQDALRPGEAFVTRFSGAGEESGRTVIDTDGTVGSIIDLRKPGVEPRGAHWPDEPQHSAVTAGQVGQVFGVVLDDASPPNVYLTATSAFGLHRNADNTDWLAGMWGPGAGPGAVWKLDAANNYKPEIFAQIALDGRANSGAALGNIAYDRWNKQLYVSDLETGMIHRLKASDGSDLGHYDHGTQGRASFVEAETGATQSLPAVAFDAASTARLSDCPTGDFARTPSCWNFADFRRRVWGVAVRRDPSGEVRLYYSIWGSQSFGNADYAAAGDDQRNSVWSVRIGPNGAFDTASVRREFFLPDFFRAPEAIARAGRSHPVTDIAFPAYSDQPVMVLAERGGVRNLGLSAENAFATPNEARVLRYQRNEDGVWEPVGRYDIGFYDRKNEGPPYMRANASGGAAFGLGYTDSWEIDPTKPDAFIWMTGDGLCSPKGPCLDPTANTKSDQSEVSGLEGREQGTYEEIEPEAAFQPYPAPRPATPPDGPDHSYMIDVDVDGDANRNDATRMGDLAIFEPHAKKPDLKISKRALAERCDPGTDCAFSVEIENVSEVAYEGPLTIRDTPDGNAVLAAHSPADWACEAVYSEMTGLYECKHERVTLAPGEKITLELTFTVPASWSRNVFRNCAELTTPAYPEDRYAYNNEACDYVPAVGPDAPNYGPDLLVEKFPLDWNCDWLGVCRFVVRVTNVGSADYTGPLHIHDVATTPGATLAHWELDPPWNCAPLGGDAFDCTHPAVTLTPGDFREVIIWVQGPPLAGGQTEVRNCARFDWDGAERDYNHGNEYACAEVSRFPPGHPGAQAILQPEKMGFHFCSPGVGPGGEWLCAYIVQVRNVGGAPYFGPIEFTDSPGPHPATLAIMFFHPPWTCAPGAGGVGPQTCTHPGQPGGLQPGQTVNLMMYFTLPAGIAPGGFQHNCASVHQDVDGDGVPEATTSCVTDLMCTPGAGGDCARDLAVSKFTTFGPCWPGANCPFHIEVQNVSDQIYHGPLTFTDLPDAGGIVPVVLDPLPPDFNCVPAGAGYTCTYLPDIPPGDDLDVNLYFPIPDGYALPSISNCAEVTPDAVTNVYAFNDHACATAWVPQPDIEVFGGTTCRRGEPCPLDVTFRNRGKLTFKGATGLRGTLSPAVRITSIASGTSGFACNVTGNGTYECRGARLDLKPGSAIDVKLVIDIPADFPHNSISHVKDVVWPDSKVKDKNPANDHHESTITILGPQEAQPAEEREEPEVTPPPAAGPVCAPGWREVAPSKAKALRAQGWEIDEVARGGRRIYCAKAPPECPDGQEWNPRRKVCACPEPLEWDSQRRQCVRPAPPLVCAPGWRQVEPSKAKALRAQGWDIDQIRKGDQSILCAKPPPECPDGQQWDARRKVCACPDNLQWDAKRKLCVKPLPPLTCAPGWRQVEPSKAKALRAQGWQIEQVRRGDESILCAKEPSITCEGGSVQDGQCMCPKGTERKQTATNAFRCEKSAPPQQCEKGWEQVSRSKAKALVRQGWEIKQVGEILCARRREQSEVPSTTAPAPGKTITPRLKIDPKLLKRLPGVQ